MTTEPLQDMPYDDAAEQATLGAMLVDPGAVLRALKLVAEGSFYRAAHRQIFTAIRDVHAAGDPVDLISVGHLLRVRGQLADVGGAEYLTALIDQVPTTAHVVRFGHIVGEQALKRRVAEVGAEIQRMALSDPEDVEELLVFAGRAVREVGADWQRGKGAKFIGEEIGPLATRLDTALNSPPYITSARTGLRGMDRKLGGLGRHNLIMPRAPTKGFKSMFGLQCALATARALRAEEEGRRVVVCYVLEAVEVWEERAVAWLGEFSSAALEPWETGSAHEQRGLARGLAELSELPLLWSGEVRDIDAIEADLQMVASEHKVALVVIDHAQLIRGGKGETLTVQAEDKAVRLATLSAELRCPFIVPSQLTPGGKDHEAKAKWSRAWDENATLVLDIERDGANKQAQQESYTGKFTVQACRRRLPFGAWHFRLDPNTGHFEDDQDGRS